MPGRRKHRRPGRNADWQDPTGWTTFTLAELEAGLIRLVQTGVNPEGTNSQQVVIFTYDVHSSNGLQNSGRLHPDHRRW